jgi:hypothetical protein
MQPEPNSAFTKESTVLSTQSKQSSSTQHGKHHTSVLRSSSNSYGAQPEPSHIAAVGDIIAGSLSDDDKPHGHNLIVRPSIERDDSSSIADDPFVSNSANILVSASVDTRSSKSGFLLTELPTGALPLITPFSYKIF